MKQNKIEHVSFQCVLLFDIFHLLRVRVCMWLFIILIVFLLWLQWFCYCFAKGWWYSFFGAFVVFFFFFFSYFQQMPDVWHDLPLQICFSCCVVLLFFVIIFFLTVYNTITKQSLNKWAIQVQVQTQYNDE